MLHKVVETGKTDDKCNNLLKYSWYACNQVFSSFFSILGMLITIGILTIGTGMLGTIFGIETVKIKKNFSFSFKGQGITPV